MTVFLQLTVPMLTDTVYDPMLRVGSVHVMYVVLEVVTGHAVPPTLTVIYNQLFITINISNRLFIIKIKFYINFSNFKISPLMY